ncbi:hypothetical protein [Pusillimonas sp. ANT_WB101]|uniref:hypothetical protein n=1 Tax=Pusillimonas sp. ANT_WB101 TaxID=2597356 RepID=UPI0011EBEE46|nr:hypothetical protein [Pusillimonas sp. ANT_WB101]KAA0910696.1 hypothetical protein FQ179_02125 [Pusillimonas sp. ANT_WB101]
MISLWLSKVWGWLLLIGAIIAGLFAVRQSGKTAGKQEAKAQQAEATIRGMEANREARVEIDSLDDDAIRDRARQRMRDTKR